MISKLMLVSRFSRLIGERVRLRAHNPLEITSVFPYSLNIMKKTTKTLKETQKLAGDLARKILSSKKQPVVRLVALVGDLGAGKTAFVQGFAEALGIKDRVVSPTFTIMKKFQIPNLKSQINSKPKIQKYKTLIHVDVYRLDNPKEIEDLGWDEIIKNEGNIILVEWAEKIRKILPKPYFLAGLEHKSEGERTIDIKLIK